MSDLFSPDAVEEWKWMGTPSGLPVASQRVERAEQSCAAQPLPCLSQSEHQLEEQRILRFRYTYGYLTAWRTGTRGQTPRPRKKS